MEGPDLQHRGKRETTKEIRYSKTQHLLLRNSIRSPGVACDLKILLLLLLLLLVLLRTMSTMDHRVAGQALDTRALAMMRQGHVAVIQDSVISVFLLMV